MKVASPVWVTNTHLSSVHFGGAQILQKSRAQLKILSARIVTCSMLAHCEEFSSHGDQVAVMCAEPLLALHFGRKTLHFPSHFPKNYKCVFQHKYFTL